MKNNFKSYSFWTALAGAVVILLNALGDCFGFSVDNDLVKGLIMAFAGLLVVLGVVTMPSDSKSEENESNKEDENEKTDENDEKIEDKESLDEK